MAAVPPEPSAAGAATTGAGAGRDLDDVLKFVRRCAWMIALQVATGIAVLTLIPPDHDDYLAVIGPKVQMLERTEAPRIVFVGGSNLAFGLDSHAVEQQLGRRVVNMGMGFNMGLRFMLDVIAPRIQKDDLVVLVPEYNLFYGLLDGDERLIDVLELYPEGLSYIRSKHQILNMVQNLPRHARFKIERFLETVGRPVPADCVYCPAAFDDLGDNVAHLDRPGKDVAKMEFLRTTSQGVDMEAISVVNAFAREVERRGAKIVMLFPCVPRVHFDLRHEAIGRLYAKLREKLEVPMLSTPEDYVYPLDYFYDWVYHLNRQGREIRTAEVIRQLRPALEGQAPAAASAAADSAGKPRDPAGGASSSRAAI
ncbi:MAG TPA: hypothetical protein VGK20_17695 [Candidatus Binatia bacterium]|jgi:hypothetical protein